MITEDMDIAGMEASMLGRPTVDDETYVRSIYTAMERAAWVDVNDRMPERDAPVLLYIPNYHFKFVHASWSGSAWDAQIGYYERLEASHWRPVGVGPEGTP